MLPGMVKGPIASACLTLLASISTAAADANCMCRANGTEYPLNSEVCILSGGTPFLARCVMVLNNTSWQRLGDCTQAGAPGNGTSSRATTAAAQSQQMPALSPPPDGLCEPARWSGKGTPRPNS